MVTDPHCTGATFRAQNSLSLPIFVTGASYRAYRRYVMPYCGQQTKQRISLSHTRSRLSPYNSTSRRSDYRVHEIGSAVTSISPLVLSCSERRLCRTIQDINAPRHIDDYRFCFRELQVCPLYRTALTTLRNLARW